MSEDLMYTALRDIAIDGHDEIPLADGPDDNIHIIQKRALRV